MSTICHWPGKLHIFSQCRWSQGSNSHYSHTSWGIASDQGVRTGRRSQGSGRVHVVLQRNIASKHSWRVVNISSPVPLASCRSAAQAPGSTAGQEGIILGSWNVSVTGDLWERDEQSRIARLQLIILYDFFSTPMILWFKQGHGSTGGRKLHPN